MALASLSKLSRIADHVLCLFSGRKRSTSNVIVFVQLLGSFNENIIKGRHELGFWWKEFTVA